LDCLALLSRFVHSDVLLPLLLPSLYAFEQCEFFWKFTVNDQSKKVLAMQDDHHDDDDEADYEDASSSSSSSSSQKRKQQQQKRAVIAEAVHVIGNLSTNCRLAVLLQILKFAPPAWVQPYADCIIGKRRFEKRGHFCHAVDINVGIDVANVLFLNFSLFDFQLNFVVIIQSYSSSTSSPHSPIIINCIYRSPFSRVFFN
jgi:hypothetical protein